MADVRHRARLQHLESERQYPLAQCDCGVPRRAVLGGLRDMSLAQETMSASARGRRAVTRFVEDRRGIAATEFAVIVPIMLVLLFSTVEFCSGLAVDRKVSLVARTIANLTSQGAAASDSDLTNFFGAANLIMVPYVQPTYPAPNMTIYELYIDPSSGNARVQWSVGSAPHSAGFIVPIPSSMIATDPTT